MHWKRVLLASLTVAAAGAIACSGGDEDVPSATPSATASASPTPTAAPFAVAGPESLDAYRYSVQVKLLPEALDQGGAPPGLNLQGLEFVIDVTGEVVNPDREHTVTKADLGFATLEVEAVRIGADEWTRQSGGDWSKGSAADGGDAIFGDTSFTPGSVFPSASEFSFQDLSERLAALPFETEQVEGMTTRHYAMTQQEFQDLFAADSGVLPSSVQDASVAADIWFETTTGVPVRMLVVATRSDGKELMRLELTLTDLNDAAIGVEPPA